MKTTGKFAFKLAALLVPLLFLASCYSPPHNQGPYPDRPNRPIANTGEMCGGMMAVQCGQPQDFCRIPVQGQCGAADMSGTCSPRPEMCTMDYRPVCGCDGKTYGNTCAAHGQGISVAYEGACAP